MYKKWLYIFIIGITRDEKRRKNNVRTYNSPQFPLILSPLFRIAVVHQLEYSLFYTHLFSYDTMNALYT